MDYETGSTLTQRATEVPQISQEFTHLPPTSPQHGYSHPISQNSMFTAPPGSRFVLAPNATVSITIFHARSLDSNPNAKFSPYVRAVQGDFKYMTTTAQSDATPVWNETFNFPVLSPVKELLILEVWDDRTFGKNLLGFVPIDLSLLPIGTEVDTWEKLSCSLADGELSIGLCANGFGLETLPVDYDKHYEDWRKTVPAVSKDAPVPKKSSGATTNPLEVPGPYTGKSVPSGYIVDNGYVKKIPSSVSKALGRAKAALGIAAR
jgi:hypothetical protein